MGVYVDPPNLRWEFVEIIGVGESFETNIGSCEGGISRISDRAGCSLDDGTTDRTWTGNDGFIP